VPELYTVPVIKVHTFDTEVIRETMVALKAQGSWAAPGFMDPEGVVVHHTAAGFNFKVTYDFDGGKFTKGVV
jgi:hypothetical protein